MFNHPKNNDTDSSKDSNVEAIILLSEISELLQKLGEMRIPFASGEKGASNNNYSYYAYFGDSPKQRIEKLTEDFSRLKETISAFDKSLREFKDPQEIEEFLALLASHIKNKQYYPNIDDFIQRRIHLAKDFEPIFSKIKDKFFQYELALLIKITEKNSNTERTILSKEMQPILLFIQNEKSEPGVTLERMALEQLLRQRQAIAAMDSMHLAVIRERDDMKNEYKKQRKKR